MLMRVPARPNPARAPVFKTFTIPPSVGGLNAYDAITDMPSTDAIIMDNWWAEPDYLTIRKGYASHGTGMSTAIHGLFVWEGMSSSKLKAATATNIYDVTAAGAGSSEVASLTNGQWQHVMMSNGAGTNYLVIANGADDVRNYDGTTWTTPTLTGVTSNTLNNVAVHQRRLWFVEENSTSAWYLPADAISGTVTEFDFGPRFVKGGFLVAIDTVTNDGGDGLDDYLCAISSEGEIAVYKGTDPATASTWAAIGTFDTAPPIGKRCFQQIGGDLAVITRAGILSVTSLIGLDRTAQERASVTNKIQRLFSRDALDHGGNFGWEVTRFPQENMLLVNVPTSTTTSEQYAMNAITGAWSHFTGMDAFTWAVLDDTLYFGGTGTVWKAWTGFQDNSLPITADLKPAFNHLGQPSTRKKFNQVRPFYQSNGTPGFLISALVDFEDQLATSTPTALPQSGSVWGTAVWGDDWEGGASAITKLWTGVANIGTYMSPRLRITTNGAEVNLFGFEGLYERGGPQ